MKKIIVNVGLARSGTTATSKLFEEELTEFSTPKGVKELKFFFGSEGVDSYREKFDNPRSNIFFESSPPYCHDGFERFSEVVEKIKLLRSDKVEVHFLFHLRNLVQRAFSHYWHDINGHYSIYGGLWSVRNCDDERRYSTLYNKTFDQAISGKAGRKKFFPEIGKMIALVAKEFGPDFLHIAYTNRLDDCITDFVSRIIPENQWEIKVPRTGGAKVPQIFYGGDIGRTYEFKGADGIEDVEVPGGTALLFALRHNELLNEGDYNLQAIVQSFATWTRALNADDISYDVSSYLKEQISCLSPIPDGSFLASCKKELLSDIGSIPETLSIKSSPAHSNTAKELVWEQQAKSAEKDGKVTLGRNDRLFLHHDFNEVLPQHLGQVLLSEGEIQAWKETLEGRSKYCVDNNIKYGFIVAPDTHAVYREELPVLDGSDAIRPVLQITKSFERDFLHYPLKVMRDARTKGEVCDETDSHWSPFGAYVAYKATVSKICPEAKLILDKNIKLSDQKVVGDLGAKFTPPRKGRTTQVIVNSSSARRIWNNEVSNRGHFSFWRNSNVNLKRCLLFTDSYGWKFQRFLAESFFELLVIHTPRFEVDIIERFQPDVVINLMAERFLPKMPDDKNGESAIDVASEKKPGFEWPNFSDLS